MLDLDVFRKRKENMLPTNMTILSIPVTPNLTGLTLLIILSNALYSNLSEDSGEPSVSQQPDLTIIEFPQDISHRSNVRHSALVNNSLKKIAVVVFFKFQNRLTPGFAKFSVFV